MSPSLACTPKSLPRNMWAFAAQTAISINPLNHSPIHRLLSLAPSLNITEEYLSVLTTKYWHSGNGVKLTVGFIDITSTDLQARVLSHMNAWGLTANVKFVLTNTDPQVRISTTPGGGYWSYLGTDILQIPTEEPTMNLDSFTMATPESEFHRVVRHETGHTMGFPHEHMRKELVDQIDHEKAITFFMETQGWTREEVIAQVLTPIEESSLRGTLHADPNSIMCYQIPGTLTINHQPILGGTDIDQQDYQFAASVYPK